MSQFISRTLRSRRQHTISGWLILVSISGFGGFAGAALSERAFPPTTYSLNIEIDGQLYTVDQGLSLTDCNNLLLNASDWTDGHSAYTCTKE